MLTPVEPSSSVVRARIPLSDRTFISRLKYRTSKNHVRVGRVLEDFDSVAVAASYKHNNQLITVFRIVQWFFLIELGLE